MGCLGMVAYSLAWGVEAWWLGHHSESATWSHGGGSRELLVRRGIGYHGKGQERSVALGLDALDSGDGLLGLWASFWSYGGLKNSSLIADIRRIPAGATKHLYPNLFITDWVRARPAGQTLCLNPNSTG